MFSGQNSALRRQHIFFFIFGYRMIFLCCFISLNDTVSEIILILVRCMIYHLQIVCPSQRQKSMLA